MMKIVHGVECYGQLNDYSNIEVLCSNEEDDFVWCTRDAARCKTWEDIVLYLKSKGIEALELSAV